MLRILFTILFLAVLQGPFTILDACVFHGG